MVEVLLVELEGVIVETREARRAALRDTLATDGVTLSFAEYDDLADGISFQQGAQAILGARAAAPVDQTTAELLALRAERAFMLRLGRGLLLRPGARELLESAHGTVRLALVTRASRRVAAFVLSLAALDDRFETIITADDVLDPKPSPEGYRTALARLNRRAALAPKRCLALEDSVAGVRAAHAAGLRVVVVGSMPAHRALEADASAPDLRGASAGSLYALASGVADRLRGDPRARKARDA
ncbi:MAG TPA: HAD family phosphatase [Gemmatimonadaceae bacterium]|nr:HAD family phosphatase [Gemmatimonadaceae bacterium]